MIVEHPKVAESAVVATPHPVKGECLYCFVTPKNGVSLDDQMVKELKNLIREKIAPFATPDYVQVKAFGFLRSLIRLLKVLELKYFNLFRKRRICLKLVRVRLCVGYSGRSRLGRPIWGTLRPWRTSPSFPYSRRRGTHSSRSKTT